MHEVSIMQSALELAEENARGAGASAISRISLRVGLVSGVVPEALAFAFDVLKAGTMAEDATLEIERVPGEFRCVECGKTHLLSEVRFDCPACGGMLTVANAGAELELSHLVLK